MGKLFRNCKDKNDKGLKSELVYGINSNDCNKYCVGQTSQYLKIRIYEHQYSIQNANFTLKELKGLKEHCYHSSNITNVNILEQAVEKKYKRENLEYIPILKNGNNVNLMLESG